MTMTYRRLFLSGKNSFVIKFVSLGQIRREMCLIVFAWKVHPEYPLILVANRDEFYGRPTRQAGFWEDYPDVLGGRDLKAGGTWMGITRSGRFASVTNFRDPKNISPDARSRGDIPTDFLTGAETPEQYLDELGQRGSQYNGFNALIGNRQSLLHFSNYENTLNVIPPGIHGLSNALLNTPWPKVTYAKNQLEKVIGSELTTDVLFSVMASEHTFPDQELLQTGVPYEWEKAISAVCIRTETYGTCCSTILKISNTGNVEFVEKTHAVGGKNEAVYSVNFQINED